VSDVCGAGCGITFAATDRHLIVHCTVGSEQAVALADTKKRGDLCRREDEFATRNLYIWPICPQVLTPNAETVCVPMQLLA